MKILLTGASSFTGFWFTKTLSESGHQIVTPLKSNIDSYAEGVRATRVKNLKKYAEVVDECIFGDAKFIQLVTSQNFDLFCHHAAYVGDYRNPDFDITNAVEENTNNLKQVLKIMANKGLKGVLLTGSVFEQSEGSGDQPLNAFSPYGLSKGITASIFQYRCSELNIKLGRFIIPNPFGPFEEPRFCDYLMNVWIKDDVANIKTPEYVRDNIHVSLLAKVYRKFTENFYNISSNAKINPSGYAESQGSFALRFASEMHKRLKINTRIEFSKQIIFSEPRVRINTDSASTYIGEFNEDYLWDDLADYYSALYKIPKVTH